MVFEAVQPLFLNMPSSYHTACQPGVDDKIYGDYLIAASDVRDSGLEVADLRAVEYGNDG